MSEKAPILTPELHIIKETHTPDMDEAIKALRTELEEFEPYKNNPDIHRFYSDDDIIRFLRARNFDIKKSTTMILEECEWRATYKPHLITAEEIEPEICTGKNRLADYPDIHGRPVILMHPLYENTKTHDRQVRLMVWQLETARKLMTDPIAKYCVVINMESIGVFNNPTPSHVSKEVAKCLTARYPERLGTAIIINASSFFKVLFSVVSPFLDSRTKSKIKFMPSVIEEGSPEDTDMREILGPNWRSLICLNAEQVDKTVSPGYNHETYWPRVLAFEKGEQNFYLPVSTEEKSEETTEKSEETVAKSGEITTQREGKSDEPTKEITTIA